MWKNIERYLNSGDLAQDISEEKNVSIWSRYCFSNILVENMAAFCLCLTSLPKTKVKFRSIALAREISEDPSINSVLWSLMFTLMKCNLVKRVKLNKENYRRLKYKD